MSTVRPDDTHARADHILRALRRISRAIDLHSRRLASDHQLTGPQLVCLRAVLDAERTTPGAIAKTMSLSQGTITGILSRLEQRGLVTRERDTTDRRRVNIALTEAGRAKTEHAPYPLQERLLKSLQALPETNQQIIAIVLEQLVDMMDAERIDASPMLTTGPVDAEVKQVAELLTPDDDPA